MTRLECLDPEVCGIDDLCSNCAAVASRAAFDALPDHLAVYAELRTRHPHAFRRQFNQPVPAESLRREQLDQFVSTVLDPEYIDLFADLFAHVLARKQPKGGEA